MFPKMIDLTSYPLQQMQSRSPRFKVHAYRLNFFEAGDIKSSEENHLTLKKNGKSNYKQTLNRTNWKSEHKSKKELIQELPIKIKFQEEGQEERIRLVKEGAKEARSKLTREQRTEIDAERANRAFIDSSRNVISRKGRVPKTRKPTIGNVTSTGGL